ncbi:hypothetical protein HSX11_01745 [Oxalobacteraceae bacterium]|nr:hypothetical protein [Oxalobacteraceae bacterium]
MIVTSDTAGVLGPYRHVDALVDRLRVWSPGVPDDVPGAELPFSVLGTYTVRDVAIPLGFYADDYDWDGSQLVRKAPPAPAE